MERFYTYLWLREDGTPYYVGKGQGDRAFKRAPEDKHQPPVNPECIIVQEWPDEALAFEGEKMLIAYYGRIDLGTGCLRNMTDGGEGMSGWIPSEETRRKQRSSNVGKKRSEETCHRNSQAQRGNKYCVGRQLSEETRLKIAAALRGKPLSEETRRKISEVKRGNKASLGYKHTEETRRRMSEAQLRRRAA